jgi:uncharacterized membrane protein YfcA
MSMLLSWINAVAGLVLFYALSDISGWKVFQSPHDKILPFILGIVLLFNAVYFAVGKGGELARRS